MFSLSRETALKERSNPTRQRNTCVALGSIAEKLAGPRNMEILNEGVIEYLLTNLVGFSRLCLLYSRLVCFRSRKPIQT